MSARSCRAQLALWAASLAACGVSVLSTATASADAPTTAPSHQPVITPDALSARDTEPLQQQPVIPATPLGATRTPIMGLLDRAGLAGPLDDAHIRIYGHVEGSYTLNFDNPARNINAGRVFDVENEDITLNQLTLNAERVVDVSQKTFDVGGRIEGMWGGDARFIHSNGLLDNHDDDPNVGGVNGGPDNQFDLTQAYVDIAVPIGNGLRIRAGKFAYFKQIDPNNSVFYSHSFTFGAALPFTLSGIYGTYRLTDQLTFDAGISRGWDQSLRDNNDAVDFFGRVRYDLSRRTAIEAKFITGPEQDGDNSHYRSAVDLTLTHQVGDNLQLFLDAVYGQQAHPSFAVFSGGTVTAGTTGDARWYGISAYAIQRINDYVSLAGRAEVYRDEEGFTTSVPQTLYEATVGVTLTPFPYDAYGQFFKVRPELRVDYSGQRFFDDFSRHDQWTFAVDAIYNF